MTIPRRIPRPYQWGVVPLATAFVVAAMWQPVSGEQGQPPAGPNAGGDQAGQEVMTRGPVHEAFGQPTVFNPKPGLAIPKKPPQAIEELPPDEKPEGDNVAWIGGYWSWDDDRRDFIWVSGFWRVLPPNRQWMPGYWSDTAGQHQWVSGYWAGADAKEQEFIAEAPPPSLEQGAPPTAPSEDHIWVPGTYVHHTSRYLWRPGYWIANQPGWVWIPASYFWTPTGYVFVDGYWDWSIRRRGVLFAPVYFDPVVYVRPGFYYRPAICLDVDVITPHFFCRPSYGHYYFGDYYATNYLSVGITPWFHFHYSRGAGYYSGDFVYYSAHYRRADPQWSINIRLGYERCRDHVHHRPARTYVQQTTIINKTTIVNNNTTIVNNNLALAKPLKDVSKASAKAGDAPIKFQKISDTQARQFGKTATEVRQVGVQRGTLEKPARAPGRTGSTASDDGTRKVALPRSPLVSKAPTGDADGKTPSVGGIGNRASHVPPPIPGASRPGAVTGNTGGSAGAKVTGPGAGGAMTDKGGTTGGGRVNLPGRDSGAAAGGDKSRLPGNTDKSTGPRGAGDAGKGLPSRLPPAGTDKSSGSTGTDDVKKGLPSRLPPAGTDKGPGSTGADDAKKGLPSRLPPVGGSRDSGGSSGAGKPLPPPSSGSKAGGSSSKSGPPPSSGSKSGGSSGSSKSGSSGSSKEKSKEKDK
jgi:hypothetical protein